MVRRGLGAAVVAGALAGCASSPPPSPAAGADFKSRAVTRTEGGVRVSTAILSAEESAAVYEVPLAKKSIQPVWIEVENRDDHAYFLLSPGLDPNFFPASEAAEAFAVGDSREQRTELDRRFRQLAFRNPVRPGATTSGFVLTNLDEGVKLVQVDLVASGRTRTFSILTVVPGFRADYHTSEVFRREIYPPPKLVDYTNDAAFRAALEALPCCVTNKDGSKNGDPLNLVVVGGLDDAFPALVRRGWRPTEEKWAGSITRMVTSALYGERYAYAPVSDLYIYGRAQDLALQKARDNIHQRNHLRLWLSPMRYHGKQIWVGQISRDIGSRLTIHSPTLTTHKIDPDVDEARAALTEDMAYSQNLAKIGLVNGVGAAPKNAPRGNLTTDPYYTDGFRQVLVFDRTPISLAEIEFFPWAAGDWLKDATRAGAP
jgi:LssY C-terminus